ncbi:hypothetical protein ACFY36_19355 [Actinoplanes sp. NPDC000266]
MASTWHFLGFAIEADWWEAWGTWIGGIGTVGALFYAGKGVRAEAGKRRQDLQQAKNDRRSAQEAQARTVVIHGPTAKVSPVSVELKLKVGNYGHSPITHVKGVMTHRHTGKFVGDDKFASCPALPSGGGTADLWWTVHFREFKNQPPPTELASLTGVLKIQILWTDVEGDRWELEFDSGQQPIRYTGGAERSKVGSVAPQGLRGRVRAAVEAFCTGTCAGGWTNRAFSSGSVQSCLRFLAVRSGAPASVRSFGWL